MTAAEMDIKIGAEVSGAVNGLKQVNTQLKQTEQVAEKTTSKSQKGFLGLSRVIQDLPFGFTAISNNLTELIPGVGALGLAFSAVVSAISFAQVGFTAWTGKSKAAKEATDEFAKSLKSAEQGALATGASLQSFVNIARDNTKTLAERNYALDQANKLMGEHGEKLTLVNINTAAVTKEINNFTQALIAQAVAAKFADKIADLTIKQKDASIAYGKALDDYNQKLAESKKITNDISNINTGITGTATPLGDAPKLIAATSALKTLVNSATDYKTVTHELQQTTATFNETIGQSVSLFGQLGTKVKETKAKIDNFDPLANIKPIKFNQIVLFSNIAGIGFAAQKQLDIHPLQFKFEAPDLTEGKKLEDQIKSMTATLNSLITDALAGLAESIGEVFSGKGNIFSSFLNLIGSSLVSLGKYVLASVTLLKTVKEALVAALATSPALGIAVGIGLIALGTVLKNIPKFATGGIVTQPTLALIGEQGPERITPLGFEGRANNIMQGEVVFQISGQSLRGILRRADNTAFNTF